MVHSSHALSATLPRRRNRFAMACRALLAAAAAAVGAAQSVPAITPGSDIPAVVVDEASVTVVRGMAMRHGDCMQRCR